MNLNISEIPPNLSECLPLGWYCRDYKILCMENVGKCHVIASFYSETQEIV